MTEKRLETWEEAAKREGWVRGCDDHPFAKMTCWVVFEGELYGSKSWDPKAFLEAWGGDEECFYKLKTDNTPPRPIPQEIEIETEREALERAGFEYIGKNRCVENSEQGFYDVVGYASTILLVSDKRAGGYFNAGNYYRKRDTPPFELPERRVVERPKFVEGAAYLCSFRYDKTQEAFYYRKGAFHRSQERGTGGWPLHSFESVKGPIDLDALPELQGGE